MLSDDVEIITAIIKIIKITPIVDPIGQFIVDMKYSSIAVPKVITQLPPINLVNMNNDNEGIKTACTPASTPDFDSGHKMRMKV